MGTQNMIIATDRFSPEIKRGDMYVWGSGEINLVTMILIIISFTNRWWKSKRELGEKEWKRVKSVVFMISTGLVIRIFPCQSVWRENWGENLLMLMMLPFSHIFYSNAHLSHAHTNTCQVIKEPEAAAPSEIFWKWRRPLRTRKHAVWEISETTPKSVPFLLFLSTISLTFSSFELRPRKVPGLRCEK